MKTYFVYILLCADDTFYTGMTSNVDRRLFQHQSGHFKDSYTFTRRPVELVFLASFSNPRVAMDKEVLIKNWSKAKKIALIENRFEDLPNLARKKFR